MDEPTSESYVLGARSTSELQEQESCSNETIGSSGHGGFPSAIILLCSRKSNGILQYLVATNLTDPQAGLKFPANAVAPSPLAHQAIHDTVVTILRDLPRGALLDVPAGEGALAARLIDAGFDVRCCDLYPEIFQLNGVDIHRGDLDADLPFTDRSFEYVTCLEGLEHIENPQQAMREFARVLKPGGHLIVSVPNILNIEERLKWLLYGYTSHFKPISRAAAERLQAEYDDRVEIAAHINPIGYSELRYILEKYGFEIVSLHRDKPKARTWAYWPIAAIIKLVSKLTPQPKRAERWTEELASKEVLLGGNTLIVHSVLKSKP